MKNILGVEFAEKLPGLLPENREVLSYVLNGISPKAQAIYKAEDVRDAVKPLVKHLETLVKKPPLD